MTAPSLFSCPYCNSQVSPPSGVRSGQRIFCQRCGESFVYQGPDSEGEAPVTEPAPPAIAGVPRWSNRAVALTVLGVMFLFATAGLVLALATVQFRRANDYPKTNPDEDLARIKITAPANLGGLGYLPADTDIVAAVHVAEALQEPAGRQLLQRFRPGELLVRDQPGLRDVGLNNLQEWTGLSLEDVDHVVLGLNVENRVLPRLTLVVQTRRSYDAEKVRGALKANRIADAGKRVLYRFELEKIAQKPIVWFAAERTLVVALDLDDLNAVPANPQPGSDHLSPALREVLQLMGPAAPAWLAGHSGDWTRTTLKLLPGWKDSDREVLQKVRTFAAWLNLGDGLRLNAAFDCGDAGSAEALERYLLPAERKPIALLGNRPEAEAVAKELGQTLKAVRAETWLTLQAKASAETLRRMELPK
jgi:hypothetical protein